MKIKDYAKYYKTEDYLFGEMANNIRSRNPIYLNLEELLYITFWKLPRNLHSIMENNNEDVMGITKIALNKEEELGKIKILTTKIKGKKIKGVGVAIASAILTIINPSQYGVIDYHAWKALYNKNNKKEKSQFFIKDYLRYLRDIRQKAQEEGVSPREIDKGLLIKDTGIAERIKQTQNE